MSEALYTKMFSLFGRICILFASILFNVEFLLLYLSTQNTIVYLGYYALLSFSGFYGLKTYRNYQAFRETLSQGLYFPRASDNEVEPLNTEPEEFNEVALQACLLYQRGVGYKKIGEALQPQKRFHGQTVRRLIKRGLRILIEDYEMHNKGEKNVGYLKE